MLTSTEILKQVRKLEIKSKKLTANLFTGEYHSAFKGRGMLFKEVREYYPGDDIRFIDWNTSARFGHPFSKVFEEERELNVMFLVDMSASSLFGTVQQHKKDLITQMVSVLTFSAINNNDKAGVIFFSDKIEKYIPPKKGKQHALYIVRELLSATAEGKGTDLSKALRFFSNTMRQKSICFILSDFLDNDFNDALRVAGNKHDVIGIKVYDKHEVELPSVGLMQIRDMETGKSRWIDSSDEYTRYSYRQLFEQHEQQLKDWFLKAGSDLVYMKTDEDYVKVLQQFFIRRMK
jgi:uncharacterized protein (DUF58 family)